MALIDTAIGLVPAAGRAARLGGMAGSKELLPIGFRSDPSGSAETLSPVCSCLMDAFRSSGIRRALIVLRKGKWDIPDYLGDGQRFGVDVAYAMMAHPYGAPFTLDAAYPFVRDLPVALGFPDMLFGPPSAYRLLFDRLEASGADVVLGLFPVALPETTDMVACDSTGRVMAIEVKPERTALTHAWGLAAWRPGFSRHLHRWVRGRLSEMGSAQLGETEWYVGQVFRDALAQGLHVEGLVVSDEPFLDIGTPGSLAEAWRRALGGR